MDSTKARIAVLVGAIVIAVGLFVLLGGSDEEAADSDQPPATQIETEATPPDGGGSGGQGDQGDQGGPDQGDGGAGGEQPPPEPEFETIVIEGGQPAGGVAELTYEKGDTVRLRVESDVAEEIHIHGYDIAEDVEAGGSVEFEFTADLEGVYEIELEHSLVPIAELTVEP